MLTTLATGRRVRPLLILYHMLTGLFRSRTYTKISASTTSWKSQPRKSLVKSKFSSVIQFSSNLVEAYRASAPAVASEAQLPVLRAE